MILPCRFISHKRADLGHILLLNTNRKPFMGIALVPSRLTLGDLDVLNLNPEQLALKA